MTRLERRLAMKRRRRLIVFSLLVLILVFWLGIMATNSIMLRMTGIPGKKNILSPGHIGKYLVNPIKQIPFDEWTGEVKERFARMYGYLIEWLREAVDRI